MDGDRQAEEHVADDQPAEESSELRESRAELAAMEDRWRRALADLDNVRKRSARELQRQREDERARVAAEWLPVVDNLELALEHAKGDSDPVVQGIRAVRDQALAVLERLGFPRRDDAGKPFDPARHQALRPAAVVVSTKSR